MSNPTPRSANRRRLIVIALAVIIAAGFGRYWQRPHLTDEEQKLVGLWTFPVGPNPPVNSAQQYFELRADRTLATYGRLVATDEFTRPIRGRWKLEGDFLIFENDDPPDIPAGMQEVPRGPRKPFINRMTYVDADADSFRVDDGKGGVMTFERVVEPAGIDE